MARAVVFIAVTFVATGFLASEAWAGKKKVHLSSAAATGKHYHPAIITTRKAGGDPNTTGKPFLGTTRKAH